MKLKWKVDPKPTGRFSSFDARGWPRAEDENGEIQAAIHAEGIARVLTIQYTPEKAKSNDLTLRVRVRIDSAPDDVEKYGKWRWATLKNSFSSLAAAKAGAQAWHDSKAK